MKHVHLFDQMIRNKRDINGTIFQRLKQNNVDRKKVSHELSVSDDSLYVWENEKTWFVPSYGSIWSFQLLDYFIFLYKNSRQSEVHTCIIHVGQNTRKFVDYSVDILWYILTNMDDVCRDVGCLWYFGS